MDKGSHDALVIDYPRLVGGGVGDVGRGITTAADDAVSAVGRLVLRPFVTTLPQLAIVPLLVRALSAPLAAASRLTARG